MKKSVFLIGGFDETRLLAKSLILNHYRVSAINQNMDQCRELAKIDSLKVYHGDGTKPFVLEDAEVHHADIVIALTPRDEDNLVICELCKKKYHVKKTVSLVSDPGKTEFFRQMGVDSVVCAIATITGIIEQQALKEDITSVMPVAGGKVHVVQITLPKGAPSAGKKLWELKLPRDTIIGCILRDSRSLVPRGDTRLAENDQLILIVSEEQEQAAARALTGR